MDSRINSHRLSFDGSRLRDVDCVHAHRTRVNGSMVSGAGPICLQSEPESRPSALLAGHEQGLLQNNITVSTTRYDARDLDRAIAARIHGSWAQSDSQPIPLAEVRRPVSYTHLRAHETRHDLV